MTRLRTALFVLIPAAAGATAACRDDSSPTDPSGMHEPPELRQEPALSADPQLAHARVIPGFGGFFLDRSGRSTVT